MMLDYSGLRAQALKVLGPDADVPELAPAITKASKTFVDTNVEFKAAREACEAKILDMDNANAGFLNAVQQFRAKLEKNDFKLDGKKDLKKIQQAQKILTGGLDEAIKALMSNDKNLSELDKHLAQMAKYKPSL